MYVCLTHMQALTFAVLLFSMCMHGEQDTDSFVPKTTLLGIHFNTQAKAWPHHNTIKDTKVTVLFLYSSYKDTELTQCIVQ